MADIKEISIGNTTYSIKDETARSGLTSKQDTLVSGTNIKTINNNSILGSGNVSIDSLPSQSGQSGKYLTTNGSTASWSEIQQAPSTDNKTVNLNSSSELQAIGVIDARDSSTALKTWTGTKAQYDAISVKDNDTLYNITDYEAVISNTVGFSNLTGQPADNANLATALNAKQDTLVSGTNIKTINNNTILGSGNLELDGLPSQTGQSGKYLTTDGSIASWGSVDVSSAISTTLQTLYPVGSVYFTQNSVCPLSALFGTWELQSSSTLVTNVSASSTAPVKGNGMTLGLSNGSSNRGIILGGGYIYSDYEPSSAAYGGTVGSSYARDMDYITTTTASAYGITTDATKSGIVADTSNLLTQSTIDINIFVRTA